MAFILFTASPLAHCRMQGHRMFRGGARAGVWIQCIARRFFICIASKTEIHTLWLNANKIDERALSSAYTELLEIAKI